MAHTQKSEKPQFQKIISKYHYAGFGLILVLIMGYTLYNLSTIYTIANSDTSTTSQAQAATSFDAKTIEKVLLLQYSDNSTTFTPPEGRYNPFYEKP